jgi:hypothetical protein
MKEENAPLLHISVVASRWRVDRGVVIRLTCKDRQGNFITLKRWVLESGRPTEAQIMDVEVSIQEEVTMQLVTLLGVQQVIGGV